MNEIPWNLAQQLGGQGGAQQPQRPLTEKERAIMRQVNMNDMAVSFIPSIINSRGDFSESAVVSFAYKIVELIVDRAEKARKEIESPKD